MTRFAEERAKEFWATDRGCTCGGVGVGVGTIHEPTCGEPTIDDIADLIESVMRHCAKIAGNHGESLRGAPGISTVAIEEMKLHGAQIADDIFEGWDK